MTTNLAEPLRTIDPNLTRDYCCALCGGHLTLYPIMLEVAYTAECATHGTMYPHMVIRKSAWESNQANIQAAKIELNQIGKPKRTEAEILEDLGF